MELTEATSAGRKVRVSYPSESDSWEKRPKVSCTQIITATQHLNKHRAEVRIGSGTDPSQSLPKSCVLESRVSSTGNL